MPILSVPIEETSATVEVAPTKGSDFDRIFPEAIIFGIALMVVYFIIRMFIALFPVILAVGAIGIAGYFGFKLL
jgi:uncharacterized membrane protein